MGTGRVLLLLREAVRKIPSPLRRRYFLLYKKITALTDGYFGKRILGQNSETNYKTS